MPDFNLSMSATAINTALIKITDVSSTAANIDSTVLNVANLKITNVLDYGALGDGSHDDTTAIQNAINATLSTKGTVYFPDGTYKITSSLLINGNGFLKLSGEGGHDQSTIITGNFSGNLLTITSLYLVTVENIMFHHTGTSTNNGSLITLSGNQHKILDCSLQNTTGNTSTLIVSMGSHVIIERNTFTNNEASAFSIWCRGYDQININSKISNNYFGGTGCGIKISADNTSYRPEGLYLDNNILILTGGVHVSIECCLYCDIVNNMFDQSSIYGIVLNGSQLGVAGVTIDNNYISTAQNATEGIAIYGPSGASAATSGVMISNNELCYSGYGINFSEKQGNVNISGNFIHNVNHTAVTVNQATNVVVTGGNIINNPSGYSISLIDGAAGGPFLVHDNIVLGTVYNIITAASKFLVKDNSGWKTTGRFSYAQTVATTGLKTFAISHDLAEAPDITKIILSSFSTDGTTVYSIRDLRVLSVTASVINCALYVVTADTGKTCTVVADAGVF